MDNLRTFNTGRTIYNRVNIRSTYINYLKLNGYEHIKLPSDIQRNVRRDMFKTDKYIIEISNADNLIMLESLIFFNGRYEDNISVDRFMLGSNLKIKLSIKNFKFKKIFDNLDNTYRKFTFYKKLHFKVKGKFFKTLDNFKKGWESAVDNMFKNVLGGSITSLILTMADMDRKV